MTTQAKPDFFLASSESRAFRGPFTCWVSAQVKGEVRDDYLLIRIAPPATDFTTGKPLEEVLVAGREKPTSTDELPANVYILRIKDRSVLASRGCDASSVEVITTGDVFSTYREAAELAEASG